MADVLDRLAEVNEGDTDFYQNETGEAICAAAQEIRNLRARLDEARCQLHLHCWGSRICPAPESLDPDHHNDHCPAGVSLQAVEDAGEVSAKEESDGNG